MKKILLSALALVALASCSKNDETSFTTTDSQVRISSTIVTRTVANTWETDDAIGVYMSTNATGDDYSFADLGTNVKHTNTAEDGATATFSSATPLYYPATDDVDLLAYYPHSIETTDAGIYSVDVFDQGDQGKIDLMVESIIGQSKTNDAVEMLFDHKLARIALTIKADGGLVNADLKGMTVTLSGTKATATYALTSDDIDFGEAVASDIGMLTTKSDTSDDAYVTGAEAIIIPQSVSATLTFNTADGNTFTATIPTTAFTIGQEYLYTVTIKNTGVSLSSATINGWGNGTEGGDALTAEPATPVDIALVTVDDDKVYQIYSAEGLQAFASIVNNNTTDVSGLTTEGIDDTSITQNKSANGLLMNNIDLSSLCGRVNGTTENDKSWTPIGNDSNIYAGTFNGGGYLVSGLYINTTTDYQALFGYISGATIESIGVSGDVILSSKTRAGGIVGKADSSEITECYFLGTVSSAANNGYAGGIAGAASLSTLTRCYNSGAIEGSGAYAHVGGIVGYIGGSTVAACYNSGTVTSSTTYSTYVGGVVGTATNYSDTYSTVTSCYSYGSVSSANSSNLGGVVGISLNYSTISYCYYDTSKVSESYTDHQNNIPGYAVGDDSGGSNADANYVGGLTTDMMTKTSSTTGSLLYYLSQSSYYSGYWISNLYSSINNGYPIFSWQL